MKLAILAAGEFAVPTLRSIHGSKLHDVTCVVTQPDRPAGRGRKTVPTAVKIWALEAGYPVIEAQDVNASEMVARFTGCGADLGLVIAFGQKLGPAVIDSFTHGCVNLHASLLPKYRGAAPIQWAVISGERETGVTVFRLTSRMDGGPVLTRRRTAIRPDETADELHDRLARIGPDAVHAALKFFTAAGAPDGEAQSDVGACRAPKLAKHDGHLTFEQPAQQTALRILGLWSWPGAACLFVSADGRRRERVLLARARVAEAAGPPQTPGMIDERLYISATDGWIELLEVKPESGKIMPWQAFVNGRHVRAGDRLESLSSSACASEIRNPKSEIAL